MSIVRQGTLPVGSLDHAITLNVQSGGGSHFETVTDTTPYLHRASPQDVASSMKLKKVVGGTIAWNQLQAYANASTQYDVTASATGDDGLVTLSGTKNATNRFLFRRFMGAIKGHKYYMALNNLTVGASNTGRVVALKHYAEAISPGSFMANGGVLLNNDVDTTDLYFATNTNDINAMYDMSFIPQIFDLTQMFGSTIADYIYSLEQAHAGAGVAWFKALFGEDYYPYNAGELISVKTSARKTYNADNVEIGSYPLDSDLELRGIPKLDSNNELYYDGDTYASDGTVTRKYAVTDLSSISDWNMVTLNSQIIFRCIISEIKTSGHTNDFICSFFSKTTKSGALANRECRNSAWNVYNLEFHVDGITNTTDWRTYLTTNDVKLVYYLATPTTESADAYTESQRVGASEEFVDGRTVKMPVGNVSEYKRLIQGD